MAVMYSRGFLEVSSLPSKRVVVSYTDNMGSSLADVRENFEYLFGMGSYAKLIACSEVKGSPDYCWTAVLSGEDFSKIIHALEAYLSCTSEG